MTTQDISPIHGTMLSADAIPTGLQIAIYGAGDAGKSLLETVKASSDVLFFIDSEKSGTAHGLPLLSLTDFLARTQEVDLVLIASHWWFEIEKNLLSADFKRYAVIDRENLTGSVFTADEATQAASLFERNAALLPTEQERELYLGLARCRCEATDSRSMQQCVDRIKHLFQPTSRQYLDFVDFSRMNRIVEGGVFDGLNTLEFLARTNAQAKVHGYDPLYDKAAGREGIAGNPRAIIHQAALWNEITELHWTPCGGGGYVSQHASPGSTPFPATTVDEQAKRLSKPVDFIKLDVEGAEIPVLNGARQTLRDHRPQLAISIYHSKTDFIDIPAMLDELLHDYEFRIGHYADTFHETIWYGIPREILTK